MAELESRERPEAVQLSYKLWLGVVAAEIVHQILNVVSGLMNAPALNAAVKESLTPEQQKMLSDENLMMMAQLSVVLAGVFAVSIAAIIGWTAWSFYKGGKAAGGSRRFLTVFAVYFGMRGLFVFQLAEEASLPAAIVLTDGIVQLLVAVWAVLAAILGAKPESVQWAQGTLTEQR